MCRNIFVVVLLCLFAAQASASGYISNAFGVQNDANEEILTNRDIACVKINKNGKDETASIRLIPEASRFFATYTKQNREKSLTILICGRAVAKPIIKATIGSGMIQVGQLTADDIKCLKSFFDTEAVCRDCPVCKGP